jgi:Holliday junction resolvase RusA-like endonuclease
LKIILPIPVSVNQLYHNNKSKGSTGRSKTKKACNWTRDARYYVQPFMREYIHECNKNILERSKVWKPQQKSYNPKSLLSAYPNISYEVEYVYYFPERGCDVFNFEKILSDFLVDCGFMLDDIFIDKGVVYKRIDSKNPRVEIFIKKLEYSVDTKLN